MLKSRRYLYLLLAIVVAVGAWTAFWFHLAGNIRQGVQDWVAQQAAQGVEVAYTDFSVGGYPYRVEAVMENMTVAGPKLPGKAAFAVPRLTVLGLPWKPDLIVGSVEGEVAFRWTDPQGVEQRGSYQGQSSGFSIGFEDGKPQRFAISLDQPVLTATTLAGPVSAKVFEIHAHRLSGGEAPAANSDHSPTAPLLGELAVDGEAIKLPEGAALGPALDKLAVTLGLAGPMPAVVPTMTPRDLLDAWAKAGGTLELSRFDVKWGRLDTTATGSFSVDGQMRPIGAVSGRIGGLDALVEGAVARGQMTDAQAKGIKQALGAIGFIARDAQGRVPFSITLENGKVMMGPVTLGDVRPIL
ncbi:DUF2125 domain-containing protein [Zavarzinia sp.]|uniref:DUF2125 domain-containing protein n=1 Tax=Zavarzinia sp. TaxID=2027920 RepID=UPI003565C6B9